jgi:hypothetical protein
MTALKEIDKLVNKVAKAANEDNILGRDTTLHDRVEALKVLTPYYLALLKARGAEEDDTSTMADFAMAIREDQRAVTQVRGNRRKQ